MKLKSRLKRIAAATLLAASLVVPFLHNSASAATNLIANPSAETSVSGAPSGWAQGHWGTNTPTFGYTSTGAEDGSHALSVTVSGYTDGDAKWYFAPVAVTGGSKYTFSDWYQSSVSTDIIVETDDGTGAYTYTWLTTAAPSATWKQVSANFTAPANAKTATVFHVIAANGTLTTDNFSLTDAAPIPTPTPTPSTSPTPTPTPSPTPSPSPSPNPTVVQNASVETAVNGQPTGWTSAGWGTNTTAYSYLATGHTGTHSLGVKTTAYTSGDAKWFFTPIAVTPGKQYTFSDYYQSTIASEVDVAFTMADGSTQYLYLGSPATSAAWKQFTANFTIPAGAQTATVYHLIAGVGSLTTDDYALAPSTATAVNISQPVANAILTGTTQLVAAASDNAGIASVQFQLDGANIGTPVTTSPYQLSWNSALATNGTHKLTAVATNANGVKTTSAATTVTISNAAPAGSNIIPNPSLETPSAANAKLPQDWLSNAWGTNTTVFTYLTSGAHTGSHAVQSKITKYTDGDAKWFAAPQLVTPDTQYKFSEYYKSTTATEVDVAFGMADGSTVYQIVGLPETSKKTWANFTTTFSVPLGAQTMTVYHVIHSVGTLTIDDQSLQAYTPVGFKRALVTLTFDDGYDNEYTQGLPLLQKYGFTSTQYIITGDINTPGYMTPAQLLAFSKAGNEMASHTVTHDNMLTETAAQYDFEMSQSKTQLQAWINAAVTDLAFPNGLYNKAIVTDSKKYYTSTRGVEDGLNSKDNFNAYDVKAQNVYSTTTTAQVADWVAQAQATNTWLVLVYHSVDPDLNNPVDSGIYNITPAQLDAQLSAIKSSGAAVVTMQQALAEIKPQL